jgi:NIMA (never in mitosis gene a)-related kinase
VRRIADNVEYALKRVKIMQLSAKEKENALNEIRILASIQHSNIIGYKEAFFEEESNTLNIVLELADDGDIEKKIKICKKLNKKMPEKEIWNAIIQMLRGLKALHGSKIMHRDIKCANVFSTKSGQYKLGDLNVSKVIKDELARTQTGTPYYASPELWSGKSYDYKSDIWSVGCVAYEMAKLSPPFHGNDIKDLSNNVKKGVYAQISSPYSNDLSEFIGFMLQVNPVLRLSADELLENQLIKKRLDELVIDEAAVNLIKTIHMPKNTKDINSKLPRKLYDDKYYNKQVRKQLRKIKIKASLQSRINLL